MSHAKLSPSAAARWRQCPASPELESAYPDIPSKASKEGTLAHLLLESSLLVELPPVEFMTTVSTKGPFQNVHDEMIRLINDVYHAVIKLDGHLYIEKRVNPGRILGVGDDLCWGTADIIVTQPEHNKLIVADLKFGRNPVHPSSDQLMLYALGATALADYNIEQFELIIYQPRLHHGISHHLLVAEMNSFSRNIHHSVLATQNNPQQIAGDHCFWCKAKPDCSAYQLKIIKDSFN